MADEIAGIENLIGWTGRVKVSEWTGGEGGEEWALGKYGAGWEKVEILTTVKGVNRKKQDTWIVEFPEGTEPEDTMTGDRVRMLLTAPVEDIGLTQADRGVGLKTKDGKDRIPERIMDGKEVGGCTTYKVKWKGDRNPTWVHWSELGDECERLVEAYDDRRKGGRGYARQSGAGKPRAKAMASSRAQKLVSRGGARMSISPERQQGGPDGKKAHKRKLTKKGHTATPARARTRNTADETTPRNTPDPKRTRETETDDHNDTTPMTDSTHQEHADRKLTKRKSAQAGNKQASMKHMEKTIERQQNTITALRRELKAMHTHVRQLEKNREEQERGKGKDAASSPPTPASTTTTTAKIEKRLTDIEKTLERIEEQGREAGRHPTHSTPPTQAPREGKYGREKKQTQNIPSSSSSSSSSPTPHTPIAEGWTYAQVNGRAYTPYTRTQTAWGMQSQQCHPQRAPQIQQGYQQAKQHTPPSPYPAQASDRQSQPSQGNSG